MKQLDVVVSPPAFVWNPYLTLTHVTFDLDPCDHLTSRSNLNEITNEATWRCCEPTCLSSGSLFDLDQCDLWPWYLWPLAYRLHLKCTMQRPWNQVLFTHVTLTFDLWPWPWTRWPLTLTLVTLKLEATCEIHCVKKLSNLMLMWAHLPV